jgi:DNA-binding CsgD family transcriptional regulator
LRAFAPACAALAAVLLLPVVFALGAFVRALRAHGMGHILDFVPNHMGVGGDDNGWWLDLLTWGEDSHYADYFDVDWNPLRAELRGKILLPFLGRQYGDVLDAVVAGACGYLLKDSTVPELLRGIKAASVGESLISPSIAAKVLQRVRATSPDAEAAEMLLAQLSDRELQVLKLIANGKDNAQIAGELFISAKTVKNHISNILLKLSIENRIQAAVYAVRSGLA